MSTATASTGWSATAIRHLTGTPACPVCGEVAVVERRCAACGADYTAIGDELWRASRVAASALEARQAVLDRVPRAAFAPSTSAPVTEPAEAAPASRPAMAAAAPPRSSATVQSVLAVAGAGLLAVAAIVFTFFNPDLTDRVVRSVVVAAVTVVFLLGARMLARRGLGFSAEAVGALGLVFLALDVSSLADLATPSVDPWFIAAVGALVGGAAMLALGARERLRVWVWTSLTALALVPLMFGLAAGVGVGALAGGLGTAGAALALRALQRRLEVRVGAQLRAESATLTAIQFAGVGVALLSVWAPTAPAAFWPTLVGTLVAVAALAVASAQHPLGSVWSFVAGAAAVGAGALVPLAGTGGDDGPWVHTALPIASVLALIVVAALAPWPGPVSRGALRGGALMIVGLTAIAPTLLAAAFGAATLFDLAEGDDLLDPGAIGFVAMGLAGLAAGLGVFGHLMARQRSALQIAMNLGEWYAVVAVLVVLTSPALALWARIALALVIAVAASLALVSVPRLRSASATTRLPLIVGAHVAALLAGVLSWRDDSLTVIAGAALIASLVALARTVPAGARFMHVGLGYAYGLVILGLGLEHLGVAWLPLLCLLTSAAGAGAVVATFVPAVRPRAWWAVLAVTSVPFVLGVVQVVFERSGWTALSTAVIFALALTLVITRRPGLGTPLRSAAASILVPSLAVVMVCLGAQFLEVSGSPVVLPVVAAIIAITLPLLPAIRSALAARVGNTDAAAATLAVEASTLLTAALTVALALGRESAGLGTALLVLVILGCGGAASALWAARRYGWWLAGAAFTGALWCAWGLADVAVVEPYLLPPALATAAVGIVVAARGGRGLPLFAVALAVAVLPIGALLAVVGSAPAQTAWRGYGLVAAAWALLAVGRTIGGGDAPRARRLRPLRAPTFAAAIAAGAAGAVQGARWGLGLDPLPVALTPVVVCLAIALAGAIPAALAARRLHDEAPEGSARSTTRWLYAPAAAIVLAGVWPAIERDWFTIWTMWTLMLATLAGMLAIALRGRARATSLPPVWFMFALAFVTAVVAWSPRDLRVEWFSLPLGAFLLAAGGGALRSGSPSSARTSLTHWPRGANGSWMLLAPGIITMLSASIAATYTDPLTWRAILVIVLALVAILVGAGARLAAPFLIGIVVLPVENVLAFLVQIGRGIESMPWWITLSVVGAVLLIIAVTYERRSGEGAGITARLRDLG